MIFGRRQGRDGNREPACCQTMVLMVSILMIETLATGKWLLATYTIVVIIRTMFLATFYLLLLLGTSILIGQLIDTKSVHRLPPHRQ